MLTAATDLFDEVSAANNVFETAEADHSSSRTSSAMKLIGSLPIGRAGELLAKASSCVQTPTGHVFEWH